MTGYDDVPVVVDTLGTFCPVPIIRTSEAMRNLAPGAILEVVSDDPAIASDLPAWCRSNGHVVESSEIEDGVYRYRVRKRTAG